MNSGNNFGQMTQKVVVTVIALLFLPIVANASIADFFGIGAAVKSVGDAAWKIYAIKTAATMGPTFILIFAIIASIFVVNSGTKIIKSFAETGREVLADGKVEGGESCVLYVQTGLSALAIVMLIFVGYYLALLIKAGTNEMIHYVPPTG